METKVTEILCKQLQLLAEESENMRNDVQSLCELTKVTGLVYAVNSTTVYTVEGNTSGASGVVANGGGVCKKSYSRSYSRIAGYGHPLYPADTQKYTPGWHQDSRGWWYADSEQSYYANRWAQINGKWYWFDEGGYIIMNGWKTDSTGTYYLGADGAMVTNQLVGVGADGRLQPMEKYYHLISELSPYYRSEIDKLVASGKLKGKSGTGEQLVLDLSESALRTLIILNR